ncbi:MAG: hypothetical protein HOM21_16095, partial [Halobacteriovoraceae bacterium]|nr:hypothetical protein [Halobacteriovoraceae bacterium]
ERIWVSEKLANLKLTVDQKAILRSDFENGITIESVVKEITEKKDLAFLLHMVRTIGHLDSDFSSEEKQAFQDLEAKITGNLDLAEISEQIEKMEIASYHKNEVYKTYNKDSLFESMTNAFLKFIN